VSDHSDPRRWWALAAISFAMLTVGLDVTILTVALPTLATDLAASTSELQWFANSYTLVLAAGVLPAGMLGDRWGQKKLLLGSLAVFGAASAWCAYAGSPEALIVARVALGLGAAFMIPLSMSLVNVLFSAEERGKAITIWTMAMSLGIPLGPVLGGWLLDHYWWGSAFLINVPIVLLGGAALLWLLPATSGSARGRVDGAGVLLSATGLVGVTYGLVEAGERGWSSEHALIPMIAGVILLLAFANWQARASTPLVDLRLFRSQSFLWGAVAATVASFALMAVIFVLPQYFFTMSDLDALGVGLRLLPVIGGLLVGAQIAEHTRGALGARTIGAVGFGLMAAGAVMGAFTDQGAGYGYIAIWVSVIGVGLGFALPPAMDLAMGALDVERSGVGSGVLQSMRQVGGTLGIAVLGTVLNSGYRENLQVAGMPAEAAAAAEASSAAGVEAARSIGDSAMLDSVRAAFSTGMAEMLWVLAGLMALGAVMSALCLPRRIRRENAAQSVHADLAR
jgi:DHA2 family multidrug resistance protein-like MFS transporter